MNSGAVRNNFHKTVIALQKAEADSKYGVGHRQRQDAEKAARRLADRVAAMQNAGLALTC